MLKLSQINNLKEKANKLEKKDIDLIISDLDSTIFSTEETKKLNLLDGRRGDEGNKYILEKYGLNKFIKKIYINKKYPKTIISKLRKKYDLILTAGIKEIQLEKLKALNLDNLNYIIVDNAEDKILKSIEYVIEKLKFIPNGIIVYEDNPKYFIENKDIIEKILGTKLAINLVTMNGNEVEPEIKKVA